MSRDETSLYRCSDFFDRNPNQGGSGLVDQGKRVFILRPNSPSFERKERAVLGSYWGTLFKTAFVEAVFETFIIGLPAHTLAHTHLHTHTHTTHTHTHTCTAGVRR